MSHDEMDQKRPIGSGSGKRKKKKGDLGPFFQKKIGGAPLWLLVTLGLLVIVIVAIKVVGCGEEPKRRPSRPRPTTPASATANQPTESDIPEEGSSGESPGENNPPGEGEGSEPEVEEIPPLSEDYSQWGAEEYYRARFEGSPHLIEAIAYLGDKFAGSPKADPAANLLANLLKKPEEPEPVATTGNPSGKTRPQPQQHRSTAAKGNADLYHALTEALSANGSPTAKNMLKQLVAGKLPTEDYKISTEAALETLARHPSPENEDILYQAVTSADQWCSRGEDKLDPQEVRATAFSFVEQTASEDLRLRLAQRLAQPTPAEEDVELLQPFLCEEHPKNVAAQILLYRSVDFDEQAKSDFEIFFQTSSAKVLGMLLEIPEESLTDTSNNRGSSPRARSHTSSRGSSSGLLIEEPFDPDQPYRLARHLWGGDFSKMLIARLDEAESLEEIAPLVMLASTIPTDAMRGQLVRLLQKKWKEGPAPLESLGMSVSAFTDPGFLMIVKSLPRKDPVTPQTNSGTGSRRSSPPRSTPTRSAQQQTEEAWMAASENMSRFLCERFRLASEARAETDKQMGREPEESANALSAEMPVELHSDTQITAQYHFDWPENVLGKDALSSVSLDPMKIDYVRFEQTAKPKGVMGFYRRKIPTPKLHNLADGVWIESYRTTPGTDRKLSIDIFITMKETAATDEETTNDAIDLVVELLCIDARDLEKPSNGR